jgi:hypothetical protein
VFQARAAIVGRNKPASRQTPDRPSATPWQAALRRNKGRVSLQPIRQSLEWLLLGGEVLRCISAGIDLTAKDGCNEVRALWEVPVNGPDSNTGLLRYLAHRCVHARDREHCFSRLKQRIDVALCIGANASIRGFATTQTIILTFRFVAHHDPLAKRNMFRI